MSGFVRGRLVAASLLGLGLVLTALPASAHDELVGATPADGAVVDTVPNAFVLEFFEPVRDEPALVLRDDADEVVAELDADVDDRVLSAPLPDDLDPGTYAVSWQVLSEDGHVAQGVSRFAVGEPTTSMEYVGDPSRADPGAGWPVVAMASAAGVIGLAALALVLLRRSRRSVPVGNHDAA